MAYRYVSNLNKGQKELQKQQQAAIQGRGTGGAFGDATDYWRDILSNDPRAFEAFEAPEKRRFQEQIIPELSEQFAGLGSGGLSSSSFRNAAVGAGTDLSERLGAIRANLRQQASDSLYGAGERALNPTGSTVMEQKPGWASFAAPIIGGLATAVADPLVGAAKNAVSGATNWFKGGAGKPTPGISGGSARPQPGVR